MDTQGENKIPRNRDEALINMANASNVNRALVEMRLSSLRGLVMLFGCTLLLIAAFNTALNIYRVVVLDHINELDKAKIIELEHQVDPSTPFPNNVAETDHAD